MSEPVWVRLNVAVAIHKREIAEHGGSDGIRDQGLLESAMARPQNVYAYSEDASIFTLAASYAHGIIKNHPFIDGNKRCAFVVCLLFLKLNGFVLKASLANRYETFIALADGRLTEQNMAEWLMSNSQIHTIKKVIEHNP